MRTASAEEFQAVITRPDVRVMTQTANHVDDGLVVYYGEDLSGKAVALRHGDTLYVRQEEPE